MLNDFFWPKVLRTAEYKKHYFQQDGARPHAATSVQIWLGQRFGNKVVHKDLPIKRCVISAGGGHI